MTVIIKAPKEEVARLAKEGHSQSTIADMLGVSRERIRQICDRDGIATVTGKVNHDLKEKMQACADNGLTADETAQVLEMTLSAVRNFAYYNGIKLAKRQTNVDRYRVCAENGMTMAETARLFGIPQQQVWSECKRVGVVFTARHFPKKDRIKWTKEARADLVRRNLAGESMRDIAKSFGLKIGAIQNQIEKARAGK